MTSDYIDKIELADAYEFIKNIDDKSVDCINTDIPYDVCSGGKGKGGLADRYYTMRKNLNELGIYNTFDDSILYEFVRVLKKINIFIWCSNSQIPHILNYFLNLKNRHINHNILTWHKSNPAPLANMTYLPDTEYCLSFREEGITVNGGYVDKKKYWVTSLNKQDKDLFEHDTIKPLEIVKQTIINTTNENDIVLTHL